MLITMVAHGTMRLHLTGKGSGMKSIQIHLNINITVMELIPEIAIWNPNFLAWLKHFSLHQSFQPHDGAWMKSQEVSRVGRV